MAYINEIYKYAISVVAIFATVMMMWGGLMWITAAGNASRVDNAKSYVTSALTGLVLALASYMVLYTVNPDLTRFASINPAPDYFGMCTTNNRPGDLCAVRYSEESGTCKANNGRDCSDGCACTTDQEQTKFPTNCTRAGALCSDDRGRTGTCEKTYRGTEFVCLSKPTGCCYWQERSGGEHTIFKCALLPLIKSQCTNSLNNGNTVGWDGTMKCVFSNATGYACADK